LQPDALVQYLRSLMRYRLDLAIDQGRSILIVHVAKQAILFSNLTHLVQTLNAG
jgi:hypothetical protein